MLETYEFPGPGDTPLLIAHGLFGSARNWRAIAKRLSDTRKIIAVDMRNHAQSPWFETHTYFDMAEDVAEVIRSLNVPVDLLGHSMGGKAAMVLATSEPNLVRSLVVADIAPVTYDHSQLGPIAAMQSLDLDTVETRNDAAEQLGHLDPGLASFLIQSLDLENRKWRLNLKVLSAEMDNIVGFPEISGSFEGRTLFLTGALSDYVTSGNRERIKELFPAARFAKLPGAGHWLHADRPKEFVAAVSVFLGNP